MEPCKVKESFKEMDDLNKMEDTSNGLWGFQVNFENLVNSYTTKNFKAIISKILVLEQATRGAGPAYHYQDSFDAPKSSTIDQKERATMKVNLVLGLCKLEILGTGKKLVIVR
jgi:hypothetical protein